MLFSPLHLGSCTARTRCWVPAMVPWRATEDGFATPAVLDWYRRFALGAPGVLVVEATGIREIASGPLLRISDDRFIPGLRQLVDVVAEASHGRTRLLIQIIDFLRVRRRPEVQRYLGEFLVLSARHREAAQSFRGSAGPLPDAEVRATLCSMPRETLWACLSSREREELDFGARERVTDLHLPHVARLPQDLPGWFAEAARRAQQAGFDGVELHFAHAYTMASFLSRTNERTDGYGGTPANRVRLPLEVVRATRARVGRDYTLGCRLLVDEIIAGGSRIEDARYACEVLAPELDFLSLSVGGKFDDARQPKVGEAVYPYTGPSGHECMPTVRIDHPGDGHARGPFGRHLALAGQVRRHLRALGVTTPIVAAGGIAGFRQAEEALRRGDCDFVAAARQSLADPDWWLKMEGGRGASVRRCKFTNYCEALDQRHEQVTCQLWDRDFTQRDPWPNEHAEGISRSEDGRRRLVAPPEST